jgi:hypothetical protein
MGDPLLGPEQPERFLPSRFTVDGNALDAMGMTCRTLGCPHCRLTIPRCVLELETAFFSILGAPASGKSFALTAMIHELRRLLPSEFGLRFTDVDPASNRILCACEESLFHSGEPDRLRPLGSLIRKTELEGDLYETIALGNQAISYPHPFLFELSAGSAHPKYSTARPYARLLCLYDNAGEHFLPGRDATATPVTRHLARSRALLFVVDPTQSQRFQSALREHSSAAEGAGRGLIGRQEMIIHEAAARIRQLNGLPQTARDGRPLICILTKFDQWKSLIPEEWESEPWRTVPGWKQAVIDVERVERHSRQLRDLLRELSPTIVTATESLFTDVTYIAISATGNRTEFDPVSRLSAIRPRDVRPYGAAVPLLYAFTRTLPGFVGKIRRKASPSGNHS